MLSSHNRSTVSVRERVKSSKQRELCTVLQGQMTFQLSCLLAYVCIHVKTTKNMFNERGGDILKAVGGAPVTLHCECSHACNLHLHIHTDARLMSRTVKRYKEIIVREGSSY